jgi:hypothetical protein
MVDPQRKTCPDCGEDKDLEDFGVNRSRPDGRAYYCRICFRRRSNEHYRRKRTAAGATVRIREAVPDGHKRCPDCMQVKHVTEFHRARSQSGGYASYCKSCRSARERKRWFLHRYGLTLEAVEALVAVQDGVCAICREAPPVHVDHDHVTGEVRGVVCFRCNSGIGQFGDRADLMRKAIDYLERTTWQRHRVSTGVYRLTSPRPAAARSPSSSELRRLISSRRG